MHSKPEQTQILILNSSKLGRDRPKSGISKLSKTTKRAIFGQRPVLFNHRPKSEPKLYFNRGIDVGRISEIRGKTLSRTKVDHLNRHEKNLQLLKRILKL